ncbi:MAG TPA: histidine triad nucleotide-binding protein [Armatimonadota bacterium]|jgi:histidine triad (HIT) family protein
MSDCLFCRIISGEIPADKVYEDAQVVAFRDVNPQAPVHILVIPRRHLSSLNAAEEADGELLANLLLRAAEIARTEGLAATGYRLVANVGADAGESVPHLHFHILGGRPLAWPPG